MAVLGDRLAILLDTRVDCGGQHWGRRLETAAGIAGEYVQWDCHPEMQVQRMSREVVNVITDDPDEAQAAFDKGAEWVRTGVMP